jgi:hypothetical protein
MVQRPSEVKARRHHATKFASTRKTSSTSTKRRPANLALNTNTNANDPHTDDAVNY